MSRQSQETLSAAQLAVAIEGLQAEDPLAKLRMSQPIAIVGIGCRFPGGGSTVERFWEFIRSGQEAVTEIPRDRWNVDQFYSTDPCAEGKVNSRWGGFLQSSPYEIDTSFFRISAAEASAMDPQQRLALAVTWEAIWDAGIAPDKMAATNTGVFFGVCGSDHALHSLKDPRRIDPYTCGGLSHSMVSGRISFLLDLHGPSVSLDTACSSSLVAVQQAVQAIRTGMCRSAIVGGVSIKASPEHYLCLSKMGMLSPDGKCKTFGARANGFVPGEGCGVVVLKNLSDALRDCSRIYAVVRGAAVTHNGRTSVITAPNGLAQKEAIRLALANAHVSPSDISFVETHGTGTSLGDPIEVEALADVLGRGGAEEPCRLGALKANIGHLEAASGIAGFIKTCLCLHFGEIPSNLNCKDLNPHLNLSGTRLTISEEHHPWPRTSRPRFAGVSSFGFSGTNAHVILEEAPDTSSHHRGGSPDPSTSHILLISARGTDRLEKSALEWIEFLNDPAVDVPFYDICHNAAVRRSHYEERLAIQASSKREAATRLSVYLSETGRVGISRGRAERRSERTAFVFAGNSQMLEDVLGPMIQCDQFRNALEGFRNEFAVCARRPWSELDSSANAKLFTFHISLARLWRSWGIEPSVAIGLAIGEVSAAYCGGLIDLSDAVRLVGIDNPNLDHRNQVQRASSFAQTIEKSGTLASLAPVSASNPQTAISVMSIPGGRGIAKADLRASFEEKDFDQSLIDSSLRIAEHAGARVALDLSPRAEGLCESASQSPSSDGQLTLLASISQQLTGSISFAHALGELYVRGARIKWEGVFPRLVPPVRTPLYPFRYTA